VKRRLHDAGLFGRVAKKAISQWPIKRKGQRKIGKKKCYGKTNLR
jgi:hypothetical protein